MITLQDFAMADGEPDVVEDLMAALTSVCPDVSSLQLAYVTGTE